MGESKRWLGTSWSHWTTTRSADWKESHIPTRRTREAAGWVLLIALSGADIILTAKGLKAGFVELNPLAHLAIAIVGIGVLVPLKLSILAIVVLGWKALQRQIREYVLLAMIVLTAGVVINNSLLLLG